MREAGAVGLLFLLLGGLLLGGCGDESRDYASAPPPVSQDTTPMDAPDVPPVDPLEAERNPCRWPDFCGPPTATGMLREIVRIAEADEVKQAIALQVLERIRKQVLRIEDPHLTNAAGRHVCDVAQPKACAELKGILDAARGLPAEPEVRRDRWETIATDLESFPTGK